MSNLKNLEKNINEFVVDYLDNYYQDTEEYKRTEGYKFRAVNTFRKNFDLEADDLTGMLERSFADTKNLIQSGNYFPRQMLIKFSEKDPEFVRGELDKLASHEEPAKSRINSFISSFEKRFGNSEENLFLDARFLSFILACLRPENDFYVKWSEYTDFADLVGYELEVNHHSGQGKKYKELSELAEATRLALKRNKNFTEMHDDFVSDFSYKDPFLSWGTWDFIFRVVNQINKGQREREMEKHINEMQEEQNESITIDNQGVGSIGKEYDKDSLSEKLSNFQSDSNSSSDDGGTVEITRRQESRKQKKYVKQIEDYKCQVCGDNFKYENSHGEEVLYVEVDHIEPYSEGGSEDADNLWTLCPTCHQKKTLGVITVDKKGGVIREAGEEVEIRNNHLSWYQDR
jgi:hypothetical protein